MNEDLKEYINPNKMKKSNESFENGQENMKNLEEKLMKSFYQHLNNCNDHPCHSNSQSNPVNNLNCDTDTTNGKPRNGEYNRTTCKNFSYRNIYVSSSSEDDDECVYTYKGAEVASNVPEPYLNVGVSDIPNGRDGSLCSSPDMDYLEMDFDPGPSNEQDSDSDNLSRGAPSETNDETENRDRTNEVEEETHCDENANCYDKLTETRSSSCDQSDTSNSRTFNELSSLNDNEQPCCSKSLDIERRISDEKIVRSIQLYIGCDTSDEELPRSATKSNVDSDDITFIDDGYRQITDSNDAHDLDIPFVSIPDVDDLESRFHCFDSLLPMDPTYCISAVVNLMTALHIPHDSLSVSHKLSRILQRRRILKNTTLVDYLFSRAIQSANHTDLTHFLCTSSESPLHSRFFPTYPERKINYLEWMSKWMKKGALPVVTRNVQERGTLSVKDIVHNQWRHNLVYKIESPYISLSNPIELIAESVLSRQLCQPPLIYVKRSSLMKRWHSKVNLSPLLTPSDQRWFTENVLGQLATIIREHNAVVKTKHYVKIPSNCQCGITLFATSDNSNLCKEIDEASDLPLALTS